MRNKTIETDFLVIGSGIAGLFFALKASRSGKVVIITKKKDYESNSNYAQGGIASVLSPDDSYKLHTRDTIKSGDGLCNPKVVETVVTEGPVLIRELISLGIKFSQVKTKNGEIEFDLGNEGGHSRNRIIHAKDFTGEAIEKVLLELINKTRNITTYENHAGIELITEHHIPHLKKTPITKQTCWGVYALDTKKNSIKKIIAKTTLLATGGVGQVYKHTTNPAIATGDGLAMAYRAGAQLANLEFMQFHPTALYSGEQHTRRFLLSEALRGFGATLKTASGKPFMLRYSSGGDLSTRDIVARAIDTELKKRGASYVLLDISHKNESDIKARFPGIYKECLKKNIDITKDPIWVTPAAHYMCGGISTDIVGRTTISNLYACGEVAHTGLHGANRLASNSLLEALVFADRACSHAMLSMKKNRKKMPTIPSWDESGTRNSSEWVLISHTQHEIKEIMWNFVGIVRSRQRLLRAQKRIDLISQEIKEFYQETRISNELLEIRNLAKTARLIIRCALQRKESRGLHYNTDFPRKKSGKWKKDTIIQRDIHEE